jgi:hypothetical protein
LWLEWLRTHGCKEHCVQAEGHLGRARHGKMAEMRRVKAASKKGYAAASK